MSQHPSDLSRPPNPPREVSRRYVISQFTTNVWFIVGMVFAFIGCTFTGVGIPFLFTTSNELGIGGIIFSLVGLGFLIPGVIILFRRIRQARRLLFVIREGRDRLGDVVSAGYNTSVTINNRHPYRIKYTFRPLGGEVEGTYQTMDHRAGEVAAGSQVYILYDPDEPEYNTLYPHWEEL